MPVSLVAVNGQPLPDPVPFTLIQYGDDDETRRTELRWRDRHNIAHTLTGVSVTYRDGQLEAWGQLSVEPPLAPTAWLPGEPLRFAPPDLPAFRIDHCGFLVPDDWAKASSAGAQQVRLQLTLDDWPAGATKLPAGAVLHYLLLTLPNGETEPYLLDSRLSHGDADALQTRLHRLLLAMLTVGVPGRALEALIGACARSAGLLDPLVILPTIYRYSWTEVAP